MKHKRCLILIFILFVCLPVAAVTAATATQYVSDQLVLSLRETADPQSTIIGHLKTDDKVEILSEVGEFVQVNSEAGTGYLRKQYLTATLPKQLTINRLEQEAAKLRANLGAYSSGAEGQQQELGELRQTNQQLEKDLEQAISELAGLQKEYDSILADSKDLLTIIAERDQLRESSSQAKADLTALREENESLLATAIIKWFLAGAGTLCFGWIMGKLSRKKNRTF
jgi:SH3 domain protein